MEALSERIVKPGEWTVAECGDAVGNVSSNLTDAAVDQRSATYKRQGDDDVLVRATEWMAIRR